MNSIEELHAEIPVKTFASTTVKRKAQRDSDPGKKQAGSKRRRNDRGSPSSADIVALYQDEHLKGPIPSRQSSSHFEISTKGDAISKVARSTSTKFGGKARQSNSSLAVARNSFDPQRGDLSVTKSATNNRYESEDEAPETVSAAAGLLRSLQAAADIAKAEETQASSHIASIYSLADYFLEKRQQRKRNGENLTHA